MDEGRRQLLFKGAVAAWVASLGYPIYRYVQARKMAAPVPLRHVTLEGVAATLERGAGMVFQAGEHLGLLVHHADGEWVAFSALCTHLQCPVSYRQDLGQIVCPCHQGVFDPRTGTNVSGPPPKPLPRFSVELRGDDVFVDFEGAFAQAGETIRTASVP